MKRPTVILAVLCVSFSSTSHIPNLGEKIVGGTNATIEEFPYQVAVLARMMSGELERLCGGSIIGKQWVLTAAHCKNSLPVSRIVIRSGSTSLFSGGTTHQVVQAIVHPQYDGYSHKDHDIGVMKVKEEFVYNSTTQPIKLAPKGKLLKTGTYVNITGWGYTETEQFFDELRQVSLPIFSSRKCSALYNRGENYVTNNSICAGNQNGRDFCYADEGGPLVHEGMQIGVAAWTKSCTDGKYPGVYTSVSAFREWIKEQTGI